MLASSIGALLNIFLNYIYIPKYGYLAAGYTTMVCFMFYILLHYIFMCKTCKKEFGYANIYDVRRLVEIIGSFIVVGYINLIGYKFCVIRYALIIIGFMLALFYRRKITIAIRKIIIIRE